jgi:hypothetical protein
MREDPSMRRTLFSRVRRLLLLSALAGATSLGSWVGLSHRAEAIIGMPFTPMSYAGVARRTTRRMAYAGAYAYGGAAYGAYGASIAALPAGCGPYTGAYYPCGGVYYRPVYQGSTVVYIQTQP